MEDRAMTARMWAGIALTLVCTAGAAHGQSLGQVAEQEASRRQRIAGGKQYTNDNLKPEAKPADAPLPAATDASTAASSPPAASAAAPAAPGAASEKSEKPLVKERRDETYWRGRMRELRAHITSLQGEIKAMETRVEMLEAQPGGATELGVTQNALSRLRANLQSFTKEFDSFQARGRRANVPADWLQ
jgi:hypothetical protein